MAEILLSPGHLSRENDSSQIKSLPVQAGAAILGPTVKGKKDVPTIVTSYSEYVANFGSTFESGSDTYSFLTSISAYNFFQNGGRSLLVTKIGSGSFAPAVSTDIFSNAALNMGLITTPNIVQPADLPGQSTLTLSNVPATGNGSGGGAVVDIVFANSNNWDVTSITVTSPGYNFTSGELLIISAADLGATSPGTDLHIELAAGNLQSLTNAFELETLSEGTIMNSDSTLSSKGALEDGTENNVRWEITHSDPSNGVFSLVIRQGNDNTKSKRVLESYANVSLDPKSSNYISRIIGDRVVNKRGSGTDLYLQASGSFRNSSRFVRVKEVNLKTPDFFDNDGVAKPQYTSSIPTVQGGAFSGAQGDVTGAGARYYNEINNGNTQGLSGADYIDAINLLLNKDDFQYNTVTVPGLIYSNSSHRSAINTLISNIQERGDAITVIDLENYDSTVSAAIATAKGIDSSYVASYFPWVQIAEPDTGYLIWVPASTLIPGVFAYNDRTSEAWFAPAGMNRGGMSMVSDAERKLTARDKDNLYIGKVNPLATFPGKGVVVFGNKTLQSKPSATDRINVRRLIIEAKSYIGQIADTLVFDQNSAATHNLFTSQVNPYLESIQQRQGLYAFKVIMDDTNNTGDVIDRNQLIGQIYLQPTRTAEFIYLDFNITPTGATFPN